MFRHLVRNVALPLSGAVLAASSFAHNKGTAHRVPSKTDGARVFSWGSNGFGQLGQGHEVDLSTPTPIKIDRAAQSVACGGNSSAIVTTEGHVYTFGAGTDGTLGRRNIRTPLPVTSLDGLDVVQVAAGEYHSAALTASGQVYTWGLGKDGQLGLGTNDDRNIPRKLSELDGLHIVQVVCGGGHTVCVSGNVMVLRY
ncbi:hypothetical protein DYB37_012444 [Aphanomyces astaci]|uniref:Uncharacterized protein n=1 Tax=Aphanomyces astaci TaxID=112090 RepID=A0A3R6X941_APHAT|nr:hypothetical protein DYB35_012221 [Aphanomyces astaci]RHZ14598.1 hypothetical protein DYB37_012444 [Aphanomyces astaci]